MSDSPETPPWTEAERLAALRRYAILDTPPERGFDDLVLLAADLLDAPIAAVNLIDGHRQWFKAEIGLGVREMPLDNSICSRIMLQPGELVVPDLQQDPRFGTNPLVTADQGLRFYAGELLHSAEGLPLGTLCVLDTKPRPTGLTARQSTVLKVLARQVVDQMELRRAFAQQARSEALRRQTLDSVTDHAIITTDLQGSIIGWNAGAENILGWPEAEILGKPLACIFTPEDQAQNVPDAEMLLAAQTAQAADTRWHMRKDGSRFWADGELLPLRDEHGSHTGYVKVMRDNTSQQQADQALASLNERYRLAGRATNDATWDWDLAANQILWNEALEAVYGWTTDRLVTPGQWWLDRIHPEDRARVEQDIHAALDSTGISWTSEYRFQRANGEHANVFDRGFIIRDSAGRAIRMIGAMLDLTERRQADLALRDSADRLRLATTAAKVGTFDFRVRSGELTWDDRCRELFGVPPGQAVNYDTFLAGLHPDDRETADAAVRQALSTSGSRMFKVDYRTIGLTDGVERWVAASGEAFFEDGEAVRLIGSVLDISESKLVQKQQQELNQLLAQQVAERTRDRDRIWFLSKDIMLVADFNARIESVNPAWTSLLGWSRTELEGEDFLRLIHPEDIAGTLAEVGKLAQGITTLRFENR